MGRIISEDATNIFSPVSGRVLLDDVEHKIVRRGDSILLAIQGELHYPIKMTDYYSGEITLHSDPVRGLYGGGHGC